jgi:hypothetical protein
MLRGLSDALSSGERDGYACIAAEFETRTIAAIWRRRQGLARRALEKGLSTRSKGAFQAKPRGDAAT